MSFEDALASKLGKFSLGGVAVSDQPRESPMIEKDKESIARRLSFGKHVGSAKGVDLLSRNTHNISNTISFVTSAHGAFA